MNIDFFYKNYFIDLIKRARRGNFSAPSKMALSNSSYQISTNIVVKVGSLILTIILARVLMPELFGLYGLVLSTILIFWGFSELGFGEAIIRFVSVEIKKNKPLKARAYSQYLSKLKIITTLIVLAVLIFASKFISQNYYDKPIYLALLAGAFYILFASVVLIFQSVLQAYNNFRLIFYKEIVIQVARIFLVPLAVILAIRNYLQTEKTLLVIILAISLIYVLSVIFLFSFSNLRKVLFEKNKNPLTIKEKGKVRRFILFSSAIVLSGVFFGYIDIVMLGYFVSSEYLGYYQAAFALATAVLSIGTFSTAIIPVFSRLNKKAKEELFSKSSIVISLISIIFFLGLFILSKPLILIIFGGDYHASINLLRIFSLLMISGPMLSLYSSYFTSLGKMDVLAKALITSTIINIILNYFLISRLVSFGYLYALYGATIATIISKTYYLAALSVSKRKLDRKIL